MRPDIIESAIRVDDRAGHRLAGRVRHGLAGLEEPRLESERVACQRRQDRCHEGGATGDMGRRHRRPIEPAPARLRVGRVGRQRAQDRQPGRGDIDRRRPVVREPREVPIVIECRDRHDVGQVERGGELDLWPGIVVGAVVPGRRDQEQPGTRDRIS